MLPPVIIIYILFAISGFYKIPTLWGINFLYYQPLWIKISCILAGGLIFIPHVNALFSRGLSKLHEFLTSLHGRCRSIAAKALLLIVLPATLLIFLFYYFRVISLYHDSNLAVYFMTRNVSPFDYILDTVYGGNKSLLYLFYGSARYLLRNSFDLSPYTMLVILNSALGLLYVLLIYGIVRLLSLHGKWNIFAFILIFTQAITFYYFGYANYYAIVPITVLLYIWTSLLYLKSRVPIYVPLILGLMSLLVHLGTSFIVLSTGYLIVHRFINRASTLWGLYSAKSLMRTILVFMILVVGFFLFLNSGLLKIAYLQKALVPLLSKPELGYGWNLISIGYVAHFLNVILLLSPIGGIVLLAQVFRFYKNNCRQETIIFFFWLALGGIMTIALVSPQTIYAWDVYGWSSIGYVSVGALLFGRNSPETKYSDYIITIASVHTVVYFAAWISLNNNAYACVNNFLESVPAAFKSQVSVCAEMIQYDIRNVENHKALLAVFEEKSETHEDYLQIIRNYEKLGDEEGKERVYEKWKWEIQRKIRMEPDNPYVYYQLYLNWNPDELYDGNKRDTFEKYFRTPIQLEPENPTYLVHYASYLNKIGDYGAAIDVLWEADSLYTHGDISPFQSHYTHADVLALLAMNSYAVREYDSALKCFDKMTSVANGLFIDNVRNAHEIAAMSYARLGNEREAIRLAEQHHELNIGISEIRNMANRGRDRTIGALLGLFRAGQFVAGRRILDHCLKENDDPEFLILQSVLFLEERDHAGLPESSSKLIDHTGFHPFVFLINALTGIKNDREAEALPFLEKCEEAPSTIQRATWIDFLVRTRLHIWLDALAEERAISEPLKNGLEHLERKIMNGMPETYYRDLEAAQNALVSFGRKDYAHFLTFIGGRSGAQNDIIREFMDIELSLGSAVYNHAQKFIVLGNPDSLYYYGKGLVGAAPELFQGYFLLAALHKLKQEYAAANENYDKVIELMPSSDLIGSAEESIERIRAMKIDIAGGNKR